MAAEKEVDDFDQLYPGRFLKSGEMGGKPITLTIEKVFREDVETETGAKEGWSILRFRETPKELKLNRTNGECIKAMFGRSIKQWKGKRVTLYPAPFKDYRDPTRTTAVRVLGSPDISQPVTFDLQLPRKKPQRTTLQVTGKSGGGES